MSGARQIKTTGIVHLIYSATKANDKKALSKLVSSGQNSIDSRRNDGLTTCGILAYEGEIKLVKLLINEFNASINAALTGALQGQANATETESQNKFQALIAYLKSLGSSEEEKLSHSPLRHAARSNDREATFQLISTAANRGASASIAYREAAFGGYPSLMQSIEGQYFPRDRGECIFFGCEMLAAGGHFKSLETYMYNRFRITARTIIGGELLLTINEALYRAVSGCVANGYLSNPLIATRTLAGFSNDTLRSSFVNEVFRYQNSLTSSNRLIGIDIHAIHQRANAIKRISHQNQFSLTQSLAWTDSTFIMLINHGRHLPLPKDIFILIATFISPIEQDEANHLTQVQFEGRRHDLVEDLRGYYKTSGLFGGDKRALALAKKVSDAKSDEVITTVLTEEVHSIKQTSKTPSSSWSSCVPTSPPENPYQNLVLRQLSRFG